MNRPLKSELLEEEVAAERHRVEEAVEAIQRRLTPGQLVDEMLTYSQHASAGFAANLSKAVSANPIPAAMIGVGLVWLLIAQRPETKPSSASREAEKGGDTLSGL